MKKKKVLTPRKQPVQSRSRETVEVIFQAAAQVFSKSGYAATTTDRIAEKAGVSIGSLYQYFPNKDTILIGLVERHIEEGRTFTIKLLEEVQKAEHIGPEMTRLFIEMAISQHSIDPELHRVLFEEAPRPKSIRKKLKEMEAATVRMMAKMLKDTPNTRLNNPEAAARILYSTIDTLTHAYVLYGEKDITRDDFVNELTDMINRYIYA